jgi:hypothetical protein
MVRAAIIVGLLTTVMTSGCTARSSGPAWPKQTFPDDDGGESLAPRDTITTALEEADDDVVEVKADKSDKSDKSDKDPPEKSDKPADATAETPTGTTPAVPEDVITTEDLVIEIEDDD